MIRTFISIDIPEEIKNEIRKIQDKLPEFFGKKTELENLHLTLKFLGEVDEKKIELIKNKLRKIDFEKFETKTKYLGFFDNIKRGKRYGPVWLHLNNCDELQKIVDYNLKDFFKPEKRFMSHLTIARVKELKDKNEFLKKLGEIKIPEIKFVVDKFKLKKSLLTSEGPVYKTLEECKLKI